MTSHHFVSTFKPQHLLQSTLQQNNSPRFSKRFKCRSNTFELERNLRLSDMSIIWRPYGLSFSMFGSATNQLYGKTWLTYTANRMRILKLIDSYGQKKCSRYDCRDNESIQFYRFAAAQLTHANRQSLAECVGESPYFSPILIETLIKIPNHLAGHRKFRSSEQTLWAASKNGSVVPWTNESEAAYRLKQYAIEPQSHTQSMSFHAECNKIAEILFLHQQFMCIHVFTRRDLFMSWISCFPIRLKTWMDHNYCVCAYVCLQCQNYWTAAFLMRCT